MFYVTWEKSHVEVSYIRCFKRNTRCKHWWTDLRLDPHRLFYSKCWLKLRRHIIYFCCDLLRSYLPSKSRQFCYLLHQNSQKCPISCHDLEILNHESERNFTHFHDVFITRSNTNRSIWSIRAWTIKCNAWKWHSASHFVTIYALRYVAGAHGASPPDRYAGVGVKCHRDTLLSHSNSLHCVTDADFSSCTSPYICPVQEVWAVCETI